MWTVVKMCTVDVIAICDTPEACERVAVRGGSVLLAVVSL